MHVSHAIEDLVYYVRIKTKAHCIANLLFVNDGKAVCAFGALQMIDDLLVLNERPIAHEKCLPRSCRALKIAHHEDAADDHLLESPLVDQGHDVRLRHHLVVELLFKQEAEHDQSCDRQNRFIVLLEKLREVIFNFLPLCSLFISHVLALPEVFPLRHLL